MPECRTMMAGIAARKLASDYDALNQTLIDLRLVVWDFLGTVDIFASTGVIIVKDRKQFNAALIRLSDHV